MTISRAKSLAACAAVLLWCSPVAAGEKKLLHCFAWTAIPEATQADWNMFFKASDALPKKIKGIEHVWYGKLVSPLSVPGLVQVDRAAFQQYQAGENITAQVHRQARNWGMCMQMKDEDVLKAYAADPYHQTWTDAYARVRVEGTTTFDIVGQ